MNGVLLWLILIVAFYMAYTFGARSAVARAAAARAAAAPPVIPTEQMAAVEAKLTPMLAITGRKMIGEVLQFEGQLRGNAEEAFQKIRELFASEPITPLLVEGEGHDVRIVIVPGQLATRPAGRPNWALHWLLFAATIATTTWAGALQAGVNLLQEPGRFAVGLPYSLGLLLILGAHELGHYFTAKAHGIEVTPPYFIPVPFSLGTFGAFIKIKSLTPNRRALFDVAVAGPLAGLVFAIPALLIGLHSSQVVPGNMPASLGGVGVNIDSSALLACLAKLSLGASALEGKHLILTPLAFAGWLGLIVTALNLLPIGQLDGGHISHALFGSRKAHGVSMVGMASLFLLALFVWPGLMFWAFIVYFIAGTHDSPAANDVTPLGPERKALAYFAFLLLLLIIVPVPHALSEAIGIHCPYLCIIMNPLNPAAEHPCVLRVFQTKDQTRAFYNKISNVYDLLSERSEAPMRKAGLDLLNPKAGESVLEIGFGTGHTLVSLANAVGPKGKVFGIDLSDKMAKVARENLAKAKLLERAKIRCGDAAQLPFEGSSLDGVFMSFALELFDTPEIPKVLCECKRVLRAGGRIVVVGMSKEAKRDPLLGFYEWTHKHFPNFVDCRPIYVREAMETAGFNIEKALIKHMWVPVEIVRGVKPFSSSNKIIADRARTQRKEIRE